MSSSRSVYPGFIGSVPSRREDDDNGSSEELASSSHPPLRDFILFGDSAAIRRLRSQVQRVAPHYRTALIRGEAGSGKRLVALAIHAQSAGTDRPFIVGDTAALADSIARADHPSAGPASSLLQSAQGGTLYLDGVGDLNSTHQAAFLRFIQAFEEHRSAPVRADRIGLRRPYTRILAAANRDLRTLASIGQFRPDLYARLSVVEILVPSLRQRAEDIPILAACLLQHIAGRTGQPPKMLADSTLTQLQNCLWPNNLRELDHVITQAASLADGILIEPRHLLSLVEPPPLNTSAPDTVKIERLHDVIQQHVLEVLTRCGGNKLRAAELLGISRSTLYRMLDSGSPTTPLTQ